MPTSSREDFINGLLWVVAFGVPQRHATGRAGVERRALHLP
ncbi:MAG: hypothetical protein O7F14_09545 [Alphaproteobacteria bacterium]|nr:hypothetical protein [Alphaproteobacteria bacterium]